MEREKTKNLCKRACGFLILLRWHSGAPELALSTLMGTKRMESGSGKMKPEARLFVSAESWMAESFFGHASTNYEPEARLTWP